MMRHEVYITPNEVKVDGKALNHNENGAALLTELYRAHVGDYPKFFKMDTLSKLGFVASELLLQAEGAPRFEPREDRAVVCFNRCASLQADTAYQATIQDPDKFFPSPSAFVYTLPNIVTGEIAMRNQYRGETSFYITGLRDNKLMDDVLSATFADNKLTSIVGGWIDYNSEKDFEADLFILEKERI